MQYTIYTLLKKHGEDLPETNYKNHFVVMNKTETALSFIIHGGGVQLTPIKKTPYKEDPPIKKVGPNKSYTTLGPSFFFWSVLAITRRTMQVFHF